MTKRRFWLDGPAPSRRIDVLTCRERHWGDVAALLERAYVTDPSGRFGPRYDAAAMRWITGMPDQPEEWHLGAFTREGELAGFITAAPARIRIDGEVLPHVIVNLLCIDPAVREQGIAALLIDELTRRVVTTGITRALFTTAADLGSPPFAVAPYMARLLRPVELLAAGFVQKPFALSEEAFRERHAVDVEPSPQFRRMTEADLDAVLALFEGSAATVRVVPLHTREELRHLLLTGPGAGWVLTAGDGSIECAAGWYALPYAIRGGGSIPAASLSWLTPTPSAPLLLAQLVAAAQREGFHVFHAPAVLTLPEMLPPLRFLPVSAQVAFHVYDDESSESHARGTGADIAVFPL